MQLSLFADRLWNGLNFHEVTLSPHEQRVLAKDGRKLNPSAAGYLAWRRGWLLVIAPCFVIATTTRFFNMIVNYSNKSDYLARFFGPTWDIIQDAATHFEAIYNVALVSSVCQTLAACIASVLIGIALLRWTDYRTSSRFLINGYLMCFAAPFILQLLFPVVQFCNLRGAQNDLCIARLTNVTTIARAAAANPTLRSDLFAACAPETENWANDITAALQRGGVLSNSRTGCDVFQSIPTNQQAGFRCLDPALARVLSAQCVFQPGACCLSLPCSSPTHAALPHRFQSMASPWRSRLRC